MTNRHREKYIVRLLAGLVSISGGILVIFIFTALLKDKQEWYVWAAVSIILISTGLYILGNAFVHKVKADLIRKQKLKEQHKKYEFE